MSFSNPFQECS